MNIDGMLQAGFRGHRRELAGVNEASKLWARTPHGQRGNKGGSVKRATTTTRLHTIGRRFEATAKNASCSSLGSCNDPTTEGTERSSWPHEHTQQADRPNVDIKPVLAGKLCPTLPTHVRVDPDEAQKPLTAQMRDGASTQVGRGTRPVPVIVTLILFSGRKAACASVCRTSVWESTRSVRLCVVCYKHTVRRTTGVMSPLDSRHRNR